MNLTQTKTHHFARQLLRKILPLHSCRKLRRSWVETVLNRLWDGKWKFWRKSDCFFLTEEMGCFLKNPWEILKFLSIWIFALFHIDPRIESWSPARLCRTPGFRWSTLRRSCGYVIYVSWGGWWDVPAKKSRRVSNLMGELIYAEFMNFYWPQERDLMG